MDLDDRPRGTLLSRRDALALLGVAGYAVLSGYRPTARGQTAALPHCVAVPEQTEGPYFVDEQLHEALVIAALRGEKSVDWLQLKAWHHKQLQFMQHERLIHLLVLLTCSVLVTLTRTFPASSSKSAITFWRIQLTEPPPGSFSWIPAKPTRGDRTAKLHRAELWPDPELPGIARGLPLTLKPNFSNPSASLSVCQRMRCAICLSRPGP